MADFPYMRLLIRRKSHGYRENADNFQMEIPCKSQENNHIMGLYTIIIGEMRSAPADSKLCFR